MEPENAPRIKGKATPFYKVHLHIAPNARGYKVNPLPVYQWCEITQINGLISGQRGL